MHRRHFLTTIGCAAVIPSIEAQMKSKKPFGSGNFGEWIEDEFGLPAFRYTCDQNTDPKAKTQITPGVLSPTSHVHQVGNGRIIGVAHNHGYIQVRQDEGAPKFLNGYSPERNQFSGGFGYLTDGAEKLSTLYPGGARSFDRIFGVGYFRKKVESANYSIDHMISAPYGDDPVLLSQVTIVNRGTAPAKLRWIEYWGCHVYQFSMRSFAEAFGGGDPVDLRNKLADAFRHEIQVLPNKSGLLETKHFQGRDPEEEKMWARVKAVLATRTNPFLGPVDESKPGTFFDDLNPPQSFLLSLDGPATGIGTDAKKFFGPGGAANPTGVLESNPFGDALLLERSFDLKPGERKTLHFLYGYLPKEFSVDALAAKYHDHRETTSQWKGRGLQFSVPADPWIQRECIWNHYYLRSGFTFDDYFNEHILSQGAIYQYVMGFQGAARDPLQHALPFIFSEPALMREVLRYTLKEIRPDGSIPYAIAGHGAIMPAVSDNASDLGLWLLWATTEYVLATRDRAFLDEPTRALLTRVYRHAVDHVGRGEHSLMRMLEDDWNDALVSGWAQSHRKECVEKGESVLNSAMAAYVFDYYARLLTFAGADQSAIADARAQSESHRKAVQAQWTGSWFRRAWLGPTLGWLGEQSLWLEPQPWAIISGAATPEQTRALVKAMDEKLRRPSPIGAMQMDDSPDAKKAPMFDPGTVVNGGVWPSLNQTLIWALAQVDARMAWDEWKKNTLAWHADKYPDIWYGVWSGPDTYNSVLSKHPGETVSSMFLHWTDFPVMNMHAHAPTLYSLVKLLGLEFTETGLRLAPALPLETYRLESKLLGVVKTAAGYEGWYEPLTRGTWTIEVKLPEKTRQFTGEGGPARPLRWSIR